MKQYRVYFEFHLDIEQPINQVTLTIGADNHADAFKVALALKDSMFPNCKLQNINIYER